MGLYFTETVASVIPPTPGAALAAQRSAAAGGQVPEALAALTLLPVSGLILTKGFSAHGLLNVRRFGQMVNSAVTSGLFARARP